MKKISARLTTLVLASTLYCAEVRADAIDVPYLNNIQNYTNSILATVNQLPAFLSKIPLLATTLLAADNAASDPVDWSNQWSNEQSWLSTLSTNALNNEAAKLSLQQTLLTTFFGSDNIAAATPQNLNDLSFTTLLGQPLLQTDPRSSVNAALNYLTNVSSLGISYPAPSANWRGDAISQKKYIQFYNAVTAIQTYNAYALSSLYQDSQTLSNDSSLRKQLITQSSSSAWFSSVISNDLGWVLRQLLLYSSQTYILLDQLVQTQKQMATSLAMTNTLLIANSGFQSDVLLSKAQGKM